jgi:hypothetical protein
VSSRRGAAGQLEVRFRVWPVIAKASPIGAWLLAAAGLFASELGKWRFVLLALAVALAFVGFIGARAIGISDQENRRQANALRSELDRIRMRAPHLSPEVVLRAAARPIFVGTGGWRMSVYVLESENANEWWLRRIARVASSPRWENGGRVRISAERSYFRDLDRVDVTDPRAPYFGESGVLPGRDAEPEEWHALQLQVLRDDNVAECLRMPSRKYAWCATREEDGERRVVALMAETIDPSGVATEHMRSSLIPAFLALVVKMHDAPQIFAQMADIGAQFADGSD